MQSWLAGKLLRFVMGRLNRGDPRPALLLDAPDVALTFPGENSWAGVHSGKPAVKAWLQRFCKTRIQIFPDEVIAHGWPWDTTLCVRGHVNCDDADGKRVYENRYVIWGRLRWGRMKRYEVYEDTQKSQLFDGWLAQR